MKIEDIRKLSENLSFYRIKEADEVPQDDDEKQEEATQKAEEQIESENDSIEEENPVEEKQDKVKTNITSAPINAHSADDNFKPSSLQNPNTETSTGLQKDSNLVAPEKIAPKEVKKIC